jgi:hypothetical protein
LREARRVFDSVRVIPPELARAMRRCRLAYLITVDRDGRAHVATATPSVAGGRLCVPGLGRGSRAAVATRPAVTLLWPPAEAHGHSLIVDGVGELRGDDLIVAPTRAVLHRPAVEPSSDADDADGCRADCIELPVAPGTTRPDPATARAPAPPAGR